MSGKKRPHEEQVQDKGENSSSEQHVIDPNMNIIESHINTVTKDISTTSINKDDGKRILLNNSCRGKPNKFLTDEEKDIKRRLKKRLKIQQKINKIQTRIKHAISRKDPVIEKQARSELTALYDNTASDEIQFFTWNKDETSQSNMMESQSEEYKNAKHIVLEIANQLFLTFTEEEEEDDDDGKISVEQSGDAKGDVHKMEAKEKSNMKEHQTNRAVKLLKNMTKGTINLSMFDDRAALLGYTRQKFYERAMLLYTSLDKLRPITSVDKSRQVQASNNLTNEQQEIRDRMWNKIQNGYIRKACAIGCGPGNDATGLLTYLHCNGINQLKSLSTQQSNAASSQICLNDIILMDWSIQQWDEAVLQRLSSVLNKSKLRINQEDDDNGKKIKTCFCDVTIAFTDESNNRARETISKENCDIYLTSYLLSETNGKWESFYDGLIKDAKDEALFYFAEPTPWQMHRFIELFSNRLDFLWVDSSMYQPSLQSLDGRVGPAILFAMKKNSNKITQ